MINKKADLYSLTAVFGSIVFVLCLVFVFVIAGLVVKDTSDEVFTEIRGIGMIGNNTNVSYYADIVIKPVETIINNYAMYAAILYILGIVFVFSLAFIFRGNVAGWNMALFVVCALLIIVFCIILSNTYEAFYMGTDDIATGLKDAGLVSYLILHCPSIMTVIIFLAGIVMMTGKEAKYV